MPEQADLWKIYWVPQCSYTKPLPKDKLVIPVCRDESVHAFLINSSIDVWIEIKPELLECQAEIKSADHPCLVRDSFVNCLDLFRFDDFELTHDRDLVSEEAKDAILGAVSRTKTIVSRHKKLIQGQA